MKKITTYIFSFLAIILILGSSSGLSFVIHHCNSSQTDSFKFFTDHYKCKTEIEDEKPKPSCCCAKHTETSDDKTLNHFRKSDCCKNTYKFLKISFQYENGVSFHKQIIAYTHLISKTFILFENTNLIKDNYCLYHPPPLQIIGKQLIYFTQNIKIPSALSC